MILRATISQMGSLRSTKPRARRVSASARSSLSASAGLILPSLNSRLIGIVVPRSDATVAQERTLSECPPRCTYGQADRGSVRHRAVPGDGLLVSLGV